MRCRFIFALIWLVPGPLRAADVVVKGRVVDESNAAVAGARVRFSGTSDAMVTDAAGEFRLKLPASGRTTVQVTREGFFDLRNYPVEISDERELLIMLNQKRDLLQSVDVTAADGSTVDLQRNHTEQSLTGDEILDVPFSKDRNLRNAFRLMPGVVQDRRGGLHFAGGAENQVLYTLDGFNVGDPVTGTFQTRLSVDAVRAIEYSSGYFSPEAGKGSAGVIAIQTKTGDDRLRYNATNFVPGVDARKGLRMGAWSPRLGVSGPVRRGRAWFSDSLDLQYSQLVVDELPKGQDTAGTLRGSNLARVQANLRPANIFYGSLLTNYLSAENSGLGALDPVSTTTDRRSRGWFFSLKDQLYFSRGALLEVGYGENRTLSRQIPQGEGMYLLTPLGRRGFYFVNSTQTSYRKQLLSNLTLPSWSVLGRHQVKAGIGLDALEYQQQARRTGYEQYNAAGFLIRRTTFDGPSSLRVTNTEASWYVMDGWTPWRSVRAEYGVRQDWDRLVSQWVLSPRASVSYGPWTHTRISAGFAVSHDATSMQLFSRPLDPRSVTVSFTPDGRTVGRPLVSSAFITPRRNLGNASYRTWTFAVERHISRSLQVTANLMRKRGANGLTYLTSSANTFELARFKRDIYDSVEIAVRHRLDSRHDWMASYSRSRTLSNAVAEIDVDQTRIIRNNYGRLGWDAPNRLMSWGYLPTPLKDWSVAYLLEMRDGFPFSVERDGGVVGDVNSRRYPMFFELDLHLEYRFTLMRKKLAFRGGFNNVTNHHNPTAVNAVVGAANFLRFYGGDKRHVVFRLRVLGRE